MIYLDNAATTLPKPKIVAHAMTSALQRFGNPGRSGHAASVEAGRAIYACRESLSTLLGVKDPFRIVFCNNCTDALNQAIKGMLPDGGHVVMTALEHNSVLRPVHSLQQRGRITYTVVPPRDSGYVAPEDVMSAVTAQTALVIVNHASNVTGAVQPVEEIAAQCYRRGIPCLVDGAQTAGAMPINLMDTKIDLFAFPGHKGLLGPQGSGGLFIRESCAPLPLREGGTGSSSLMLTQPQDMPELYESGTAATPAIAGLGAGVAFVSSHMQEIISVEHSLTQELWEGLSGIKEVTLYGPQPSQKRLGVVTCNIGTLDASAAADVLSSDYSIACRAGLHCAPLAHQFLGTQNRGAIRFSVGPFNTSEEIHTVVRAVHRLAKRGLT